MRIVGANQASAAFKMAIPELVILTRDGCPNTGIMQDRLETALQSLGWTTTFRVIDIGDLPDSDPRGGYGTPTILCDGEDLFGLSRPSVPHAPPT